MMVEVARKILAMPTTILVTDNGNPTTQTKKRTKIKCFICDGSHMVKNCSKRFVLSKNDNSEGDTKRLGSSASGVKDKKSKESEKKPIKCFLCYGPHRLWNCPKKSIVEGDDGSEKMSMKLGSIVGRVKANRVKRNKKELVKCFLCSGRMSCGTV